MCPQLDLDQVCSEIANCVDHRFSIEGLKEQIAEQSRRRIKGRNIKALRRRLVLSVVAALRAETD